MLAILKKTAKILTKRPLTPSPTSRGLLLIRLQLKVTMLIFLLTRLIFLLTRLILLIFFHLNLNQSRNQNQSQNLNLNQSLKPPPSNSFAIIGSNTLLNTARPLWGNYKPTNYTHYGAVVYAGPEVHVGGGGAQRWFSWWDDHDSSLGNDGWWHFGLFQTTDWADVQAFSPGDSARVSAMYGWIDRSINVPHYIRQLGARTPAGGGYAWWQPKPPPPTKWTYGGAAEGAAAGVRVARETFKLTQYY